MRHPPRRRSSTLWSSSTRTSRSTITSRPIPTRQSARRAGLHGRTGTPSVDNLASAHLLTNNPNFTNKANGADAAEPFRLDRTQANTADQNHAYTAEQQAYDGGKADLFPKYTGKGTPGGVGAFATKGQVMGYFDGNTVTRCGITRSISR
jgi:phospholipase C